MLYTEFTLNFTEIVLLDNIVKRRRGREELCTYRKINYVKRIDLEKKLKWKPALASKTTMYIAREILSSV